MGFQISSYSSSPSVLSAQTETLSEDTSDLKEEVDTQSPHIYVEISGAILEPDVYEVPPGTRLKKVIEMAGGLSDLADKRYVARNYNLAKFVGDQEKIYIPYLQDISNGTFVEQKRILEYLSPLYSTQSKPIELGVLSTPQSSGNISLNSASLSELDTLPGVGPVTAQKITDNRPYTSIDELVSKSVVNQSTFDKIRDLVSL